MRNNKKRGFTLVELLVVIAILAILATVSVVGYTSFIQRASISNDENVAAQLNKFLVAVKADSTGPFYNEPINEDNVWDVTQYILKESGLNELEAQSAKYGYHIYFDLTLDEYVVVEDKDAIDAPSSFDNFLIALSASAADKTGLNSLNPTTCFTKGGNYCLVETKGEWAELIDAYYNVTSQQDLRTLYTAAQAMKTDKNHKIPGLAFLIETTTFITESGNFVVLNSAEHNTFVIQEEATTKEDGTKNDYVIAGTKIDLNGGVVTISATNPLFKPNNEEKEYVIELPEEVKYISPSFAHVANPNKTVTNEDGTTSTVPTYDVTIIINRETAEQIAAIVELGMKYSGVNLENSTGLNVTITDTEVIVGDQRAALEEKNKVTDFKVSVTHTNTNKINPSESSAFIAWDGKTFTLTTSDFKGAVAGQPVNNTAVTWSLVSATGANTTDEDGNTVTVDYSGYVKFVDGVLTLDAVPETGVAPEINEIVVKAVSVSGNHEETYTLKVVRITGITGITLGGEDVELDGEDEFTFVNVQDTNNTNPNKTFSLGYDEKNITYNYDNSGVKPDIKISIVNTNAELELTNDNKTIALVSTLEDLPMFKTISIKIDNLLTEDLSVRFISAKDLDFVVNEDYENIALVGDDSKILLGTLFSKSNNAALPANAQVWFGSGFGGVDSAPGTIDMTSYTSSRHGAVTTVSVTDWAKTEIQFLNGIEDRDEAEADEVYVAIVVPNDPSDPSKGGRRISETRKISVVDGHNINSENYAEVIAKANSSTSFVLWSDLTMTSDKNAISVKHLYGNNFTYNIEAGEINGTNVTGVITLYGTLRDVKIIGKVYPTFSFTVGNDYGTSAIYTTNSKAKIINSYIANCRSPLRLNANTLVKDSVIFGGRYSNIDIPGNFTLTIDGTVVTVQQPISGGSKDVLGMGIAAWFSDNQKFVVINDGATFKQYNFLDKTCADDLPVISLRPSDIGVDLDIMSFEVMNLSNLFKDLLNKGAIYSDYYFVDDNGTPNDKTDDTMYVNSGLAGLDKYFMKYTAEITETKDIYLYTKDCVRNGDWGHSCTGMSASPCCSKDHDHVWDKLNCGLEDVYDKYVKEITFTFEKLNTESTDITLKYDTTKFTSDTDTTATGEIKVTDWTGAVGDTKTFKFTVKDEDMALVETYNMWNDFTMDASDNINMLVVNNRAGIAGYGNTEYTVKVNIANFIWNAVKEKLAGKGIHSKSMTIDIWTPKAADNKELFKEYLEMTDGDGTNDNYYMPDVFEFNSEGKITFLTLPEEGEQS